MADEETGHSEAWRPEAGEKITGKVVGLVMSADMGYGPYPILTLETPAGERNVHAFHQILRTELARRRPKVGDDIEITYVGKRSPKSGNGNPFHVYRVTGGQEPEFDWDSQLPEEERQRAVERTAEPPIPPAPTPSQRATQPVAASIQDRAAQAFPDDEVPF